MPRPIGGVPIMKPSGFFGKENAERGRSIAKVIPDELHSSSEVKRVAVH